MSRKRWAESAKHLAFLRFRFTDPCLSFALHRSCDTNIQYIDIIIINRRYNLLLREGSSSPFFPFLFFPLLLFSLSLKVEIATTKAKTNGLQLFSVYSGGGWEEGDYAAEPEELAERKRRNFFPLFFVLIAPGALGRGGE